MGCFWILLSFSFAGWLIQHGVPDFWAAFISVVSAIVMIQITKPREKRNV
jgi:hypothetical protein